MWKTLVYCNQVNNRVCYSDEPDFWSEWKAELSAIGTIMIQDRPDIGEG